MLYSYFGDEAVPRRRFLRTMAAAGLAAAAAGAAGCAPTRPPDPPGVVTLEFYTYASPEFLALYEGKLIPAFEKKHPNIRVRMNSSLGDAGYDAKLLTLLAGGLAPDLFHVTQQNFPFYAAKEVLLPLDDFLKRDADLSEDAFFPQVTEGMRYKGQLLGLPSDFSTIVMLYNRDLFDRFGVRPPDDSWSREEFLETCRALTRDTDGDKRTDVWGTVNPGAYNRWPAWVWMNGGELFTPDLSQSRMDEPAAIEGMEFYAGLSRTHRVAPLAGQTMGQGFQELFTSQTAAIIPDSRFAYARFLGKRRLKFRWDLAHMPAGRERATTFIWGGNCILKETRHPEEAWTFLKFLSGPEGAAINREAGNALPAYRPAAEEEVRRPSIAGAPAGDRRFLEAVAYGRTAPTPPQFAEYSQLLSDLQDAFLELTPVDEACRRFARETNRLLASEVF